MGILDGFIEKLFDNMMALMPFVIVKSYERGCRWTLGRNPKELGPGPHWRLYLYHSVEIGIVVADAIETPVQSVITKDEKLLCFNVGFTYEIEDFVAHNCNVTDFQSSTLNLACQHLAKRMRGQNLKEIADDLTKIEVSLKDTLTTLFKPWGTKVLKVGFINFAEVPQQIRIFADGHDHPVVISPAS